MRFNQCGFRKGFNTQHIYVAMILKMKTGGNKQFLSWACDETGQHNGKKKKNVLLKFGFLLLQFAA